MHQDLIDEAFRAANRMAADRGISLDGTALMRAVLAVAGEGEGQNEPEEIAEDAMELLGKDSGALILSARPQTILAPHTLG
ncbi:hypothetical protein HUN39_02395 [Methylocystis sp. FS]|uniref:hypothetical protein n=1 Tax=Methylocystis silviterrae TaxID=2743612 RepID=UPI001583C0DD|nr:hypothetical protein [Methylocystis silviterrae]NUJ78897.1 hypothetical protein [Methylocystis silviterrae]